MAERRKHYTASFKKKVILYAEKSNNVAAERRFKVSECNVRRWRQQREKLDHCSATRKSFSGPKKGRHADLENELCDFLNGLRSRSLPVTTEIIQTKSRELALAAGISESDFKASRSWVKKFMNRAGFSLRGSTSINKMIPIDFVENLTNFQRYIIAMRTENAYLPGQIGNCDQMLVHFDSPPSSTVTKTDAKHVNVSKLCCKDIRITVLLCCTADGGKLPPYVVLNRKTIPKGEKFPPGVIVNACEKGMITSEIMVDWLKVVWLQRPGYRLKSLLVMDSCQEYETEEVKKVVKDGNSDLVFIPEGMKSQLQPLDVGINTHFKNNVNMLYTEWLEADGREFTPTSRVKIASVSQKLRWVVSAWRAVGKNIIVKSFKKCSISNALDGSEDGVIWEESNNEDSSLSDLDEECDSE